MSRIPVWLKGSYMTTRGSNVKLKGSPHCHQHPPRGTGVRWHWPLPRMWPKIVVATGVKAQCKIVQPQTSLAILTYKFWREGCFATSIETDKNRVITQFLNILSCWASWCVYKTQKPNSKLTLNPFLVLIASNFLPDYVLFLKSSSRLYNFAPLQQLSGLSMEVLLVP